jgi:hypothetical protein
MYIYKRSDFGVNKVSISSFSESLCRSLFVAATQLEFSSVHEHGADPARRVPRQLIYHHNLFSPSLHNLQSPLFDLHLSRMLLTHMFSTMQHSPQIT